MWVLIIAAIVGGFLAVLKCVSIEGIEAPQPTPFSEFLGWGGIVLMVIGIVAAIYEIAGFVIALVRSAL